MSVLMVSPGFPAEMSYFTRGLAAAGATVIGLGDQPAQALPAEAARALAHYVPVRSLADSAEVRATVRELAGPAGIGQVECL